MVKNFEGATEVSTPNIYKVFGGWGIELMNWHRDIHLCPPAPIYVTEVLVHPKLCTALKPYSEKIFVTSVTSATFPGLS